MKAISMLKFRQDANKVLSRVQKGERFVLTYRGKAVARLEPVETSTVNEDDPIFRLHEIAERMGVTNDKTEPLTNKEIDRIVYGQ